MTHTKRERDALIRNSRPVKQLRLDQIKDQEEEAKRKLDLVALDQYYRSGEDYDSLDESDRDP